MVISFVPQRTCIETLLTIFFPIQSLLFLMKLLLRPQTECFLGVRNRKYRPQTEREIDYSNFDANLDTLARLFFRFFVLCEFAEASHEISREFHLAAIFN